MGNVLRAVRAWGRRREARRLERRGIAAVAARLPRGGLFLLYAPDRKITPIVLGGAEWQRPEFDHLESFVRERGLAPAAFVDVGANVGTHSVYACASTAFSRVVSIEPNPALLPLLEANLAIHARGKPFRVLACGAHREAGELPLAFRHGNVGAGSFRAGRRADARPTVPVRALDEMLAEECASGEPVALWLDVESHEAEALRGASDLLRRGRLLLCIEVRPRRTTTEDQAFLDALLNQATDLRDARSGLATDLGTVWGGGEPRDLLAYFPAGASIPG